MSFRQPRRRTSPSHQRVLAPSAYSQGFASSNAPNTLHQPAPSAQTSVSECQVLNSPHYYNISNLCREEGPLKRLHQAPIQWSSGISVISLLRYLFRLLKAIQENAPGMGCGPKSWKDIYFMRRMDHEQRAPAFRSIPLLRSIIPAARRRVVAPVCLT
jgi:hypothetical protein